MLLSCPSFLCGKKYHRGTEITKIHREYTKDKESRSTQRSCIRETSSKIRSLKKITGYRWRTCEESTEMQGGRFLKLWLFYKEFCYSYLQVYKVADFHLQHSLRSSLVSIARLIPGNQIYFANSHNPNHANRIDLST